MKRKFVAHLQLAAMQWDGRTYSCTIDAGTSRTAIGTRGWNCSRTPSTGLEWGWANLSLFATSAFVFVGSGDCDNSEFWFRKIPVGVQTQYICKGIGPWWQGWSWMKLVFCRWYRLNGQTQLSQSSLHKSKFHNVWAYSSRTRTAVWKCTMWR